MALFYSMSCAIAVASLQQMVASLKAQKQYLPLAELEPQLWYEPFPASAYHEMVAAQEEVIFLVRFILLCSLNHQMRRNFSPYEHNVGTRVDTSVEIRNKFD